jgi:hypothetical protein
MGRRHQDMWKLRLSILLPAVQLPLAVIRWEWGARSTIRLLALVIGGLAHSFVMGSMLPLFFLRFAVFPFTRDGRPWPHPSIFGYGPEKLAFFLGVAILWFVVGKLLDRRRSDKVPSEKRVTVREALISSFMIVLGIVMGIALFAEGLEGLLDSLQVGRLLGNDRRKHSFCSMVVCVDLCLGAHTDDCDPSGDVALVYLVYRSTWASRWASIAPLPMVNRIPRGGGENEGGEMCPGRWSQHPQSGTGLRVRSLRACLAAPPVDQLECPPW